MIIKLMKKITFMLRYKKVVAALFFVFLGMPNIILGIRKVLIMNMYWVRTILILILKGGVSFVRSFGLERIQGSSFWQVSPKAIDNTVIAQS